MTFSFDGKFTSYDYLKKFRKICGKYREEMWEIKKRNLGEFPSNLCQGLIPFKFFVYVYAGTRTTFKIAENLWYTFLNYVGYTV